jgi:hypothetical protein
MVRGCANAIAIKSFGTSGPEIGEPVRSRLKHEDGDRKGRDILLKGQASIHGNERVELLCGKCQ